VKELWGGLVNLVVGLILLAVATAAAYWLLTIPV